MFSANTIIAGGQLRRPAGRSFDLESLEFVEGSYSTGRRRVSFFAKVWPTPVFFLKFFWIVWRAAGKAKRGKYGDGDLARSSRGVIGALESVGVKFDLEGIENMKSFEGPCVFVSNHMSTLETVCFPGIILPFKSVTFVVKESLLHYPVFRHIMRAMKAVGVTRRNPREDLRAVLADGGRILGEGKSVVVFPQTTRTTEFDPSDFNSLGVKLARRAGVPVVPVALKSDAWGAGPSFMRDIGRIDPSKTVSICFGEPLVVEGRGDAEHGKVVEFIGSKLEEWNARRL